MAKWKILESKDLAKLGLFRVRQDKCELPDGRIMPKYYVVEFPDWAQVIAITEDGQMVMVNQYRHAAEDRFLEVPGGTIEPHNGESNVEGALRELEEETGYTGELKYVGSHYPNPALQTNKVDVFVAKNCRLEKLQQLDPYEDIEVVLMPVSEVYRMAEQGKITHGLMLASLMIGKPHLKEFL